MILRWLRRLQGWRVLIEEDKRDAAQDLRQQARATTELEVTLRRLRIEAELARHRREREGRT